MGMGWDTPTPTPLSLPLSSCVLVRFIGQIGWYNTGTKKENRRKNK